MKAKFFSSNFFFGVVVVFAVICLFVVFFGVVRTNAHVVSRVGSVSEGVTSAVHRHVDTGDAVAVSHCVGADNQIATVNHIAVNERIITLEMPEHLAAVVHLAADEYVAASGNGVVNGIHEV
jgi:hypothetical protein